MTQAPFWYFGGKAKVAPVVWQMLGDVQHYVEPFAGSLAVLLRRPQRHRYRLATANDKDGYIANVWRALKYAPNEVARYANWPAIENDLHARHIWLLNQADELVLRLEGNPDYYDAKIAGWWLWCNANWIGSHLCNGDGPWNTDGVRRISIRRIEDVTARGVRRQRIHLNSGQGVRRNITTARQQWLETWFADIARVIEDTRVACGDWTRIVTDGALALSALDKTGIFLDPPYEHAERNTDVYNHDDVDIALDSAKWAIEKAADGTRIVYAGYAGAHVEQLLLDAGWGAYAWKAHGGMANNGADRKKNKYRERLWYSPAIVETYSSVPKTLSLW